MQMRGVSPWRAAVAAFRATDWRSVISQRSEARKMETSFSHFICLAVHGSPLRMTELDHPHPKLGKVHRADFPGTRPKVNLTAVLSAEDERRGSQQGRGKGDAEKVGDEEKVQVERGCELREREQGFGERDRLGGAKVHFE